MTSLRIEQTPLGELRPYKANARTHSRRQIRQIAASLEKFGFCNPILVDNDLQIIAGHGRVEAAKLLGMTSVPIVRLSHLSDEAKRAYVIADNKLALQAGWDRSILAIELQGLIDIGFEVELTGFETAEIDIILDDALEASTAPLAPEDRIPNAVSETPTTCLGDLWILGGHRLLCGDGCVDANYEALLKERRADLVFTDPPYNVPIDGHVSGLGKIQHLDFAMASGEMTEGEFRAFLTKALGCLARFSRQGAIQYVCMDWRHMTELLAAGRDIYGAPINLCVWNKSNGGMGSFYRSKHELVFVFKVGDAPHINNVELGRHGRNRTNVWDYAGVNGFRAGRGEDLSMHPTVKPVALVSDAIKDTTRRGDLVLDPFSGSGTTLIASEKTGRRAAAIELSAHYVDVAVQRWQTLTGKAAILEASGVSFEDITEQRLSTIPQPEQLLAEIASAP